ncbi:hypothetical protein ERO13_A06G047350v2 [Gossypium hirsutum]|uniref:Uncharacterized protein n=2 Tax=Gossypium TaxID=3633 RepID=A0A5J5VA53_GOSBA|nr:hypothetical protein ES319_A06G053000v1 [Gossypium barbadense]KAG4194324.1 hypothetical protein ERO13_A06G047350v2 [Gossypium hirsutum]TYH12311.1 hypothetical protein ES288_A06G057500v1 [Gossypium darwinii]
MLCSCMNPSPLVAPHIKPYVLKTHIDMVDPTQNTLAIAQTKQSPTPWGKARGNNIEVVFLHPRSRSFQSNWKTSFTSS